MSPWLVTAGAAGRGRFRTGGTRSPVGGCRTRRVDTDPGRWVQTPQSLLGGSIYQQHLLRAAVLLSTRDPHESAQKWGPSRLCSVLGTPVTPLGTRDPLNPTQHWGLPWSCSAPGTPVILLSTGDPHIPPHTEDPQGPPCPQPSPPWGCDTLGQQGQELGGHSPRGHSSP